MEIPVKKRLFYFFPVLFCFALPFGSQLLSVIIGLWFVTSFFNIEWLCFFNGLRNRNFIIMQMFFFLTVISAAFSQNKAEGLKAIEVKLSFFILPFLFFCFNWPVPILKRMLVAFVSGCFFACCYLLVRATLYSFQGHTEYFFYSDFSGLIHASYFAMYLTFASVIVLVFYKNWFISNKTVVNSAYVFVAVFALCILLCSSKLGLIGMAICIPLLVYHKFKSALTPKRLLIFIIGFVVFGLLLYLTFPKPFQRLNSLYEFSSSGIDKTTSESTGVRALIWKESVELVKTNFWFGTGVGDVNDDLYNVYEKQGMTGALEHKLNAHSQYLQTFIGMGCLGFALLLLLTVGRLMVFTRHKNFYAMIFSLLILLNFFVESMLQTASGVLFFAFFYCFTNIIRQGVLRNENG